MAAPVTSYTPSAADALFDLFTGIVFNDPGSAAYAATDPNRIDSKFFLKPIQDEVLNLIQLMLYGKQRARNETGGMFTKGTSVYDSSINGVAEEGDAAAQLSAWTATGVTLSNTNNLLVYWTLTNSGTTRTVNIYKDAAHTTLLATGNRVGDGAITLAASGGSGLNGTVTVAYTGDDTDTANKLYLGIPLLAKADATDPAKQAKWVLDADLATDTTGYVYPIRIVSGIDTSAGSVGDAVYLDPATPGAWTITKPTAAAYRATRLGRIMCDDATNGVILFYPGDKTVEFFSSADLQPLYASALGRDYTPGGRLTLLTAVPVPTTDQASKTLVYYTPHKTDLIPLYDGTNWILTPFTELTNDSTDATKNPAAVTTNVNYDLFVWNDAGTLRLGRGPLWTTGGGSATARGTGAGSTELQSLNGILTNRYAITNGPIANKGTYVGSFRSDGSSQMNDTTARRNVWNLHNRVIRHLLAHDTTDTWNYTTATWREANGSTTVGTARVEMMRGLDEDNVNARVISPVLNASNVIAAAGIGLDSVTVNSALIFGGMAQAVAVPNLAEYNGMPGLGYHYLNRLEISTASGTTTWYGDNGSTMIKSGMLAEVLA